MIKSMCNRVRVWATRPYTEEEARVDRIAAWAYGITIALIIYANMFLTVIERTGSYSY